MLFASQIVKLLALFSPKIKLFVEGRKTVFQSLESKISSSDKTIELASFKAPSGSPFIKLLPGFTGVS